MLSELAWEIPEMGEGSDQEICVEEGKINLRGLEGLITERSGDPSTYHHYHPLRNWRAKW